MRWKFRIGGESPEIATSSRRRPPQIRCAFGDAVRAQCLSDPRRIAQWPAGCASCASRSCSTTASRDDLGG